MYQQIPKSLVLVSKLFRGGVKIVFEVKSCIEFVLSHVLSLSERGNLFIWKTIGFGNHEKLSVDNVFRLHKTYVCRETEEKIESFSEQKIN